MIPLWAYGAAGALLAGFLGGWTVRDWKADSDALAAVEKADKAKDKAREEGLAQGRTYAQFAADNLTANQRDHTTIREVFRNVTVPADCAVPTAGVGVLESARDRANAAATGQPVPTVSASAGPAGGADRP